MPSLATPPVNPNLEQLAAEAEALSAEGRDEQAYSLYQLLLERLMVTHGEDHLPTLSTMLNMGVSLLRLDRVVEAHSTFEKVLPKLVSAIGDEHPITLLSTRCLASTLYHLDRYDEALAMFETLLPRQVRIQGEDHALTLSTMGCMALVQLEHGRFDDAHRTASRGLLLARKVDNELQVALFVDILSQIEQDLGRGEKGEQKKKSSKPAGVCWRGWNSF
jgi:tetratricopeptide (TPR) repeat protein